MTENIKTQSRLIAQVTQVSILALCGQICGRECFHCSRMHCACVCLCVRYVVKSRLAEEQRSRQTLILKSAHKHLPILTQRMNEKKPTT